MSHTRRGRFLRHNDRVNRALLLALTAVVSCGASACARKAPALPLVTALAVPTPPARTLIPVELPEYVEPAPEPVVEETPAPAPSRPPSTARNTEKPPAAPPQVRTPPPVLQATTTATAPSALEQRVRGLLASAEEKLKVLNYRELDPQRLAHYNQVRDFIRMANDNLRIRNYVYAEQLATKANTVAGLLTRS